MTEDGEKALLREYLATCERLRIGFADTVGLIARLLPIHASTIDDLPTADVTMLLAFMKRFEQFQDALGRTLKAISKVMEHGKVERLTSRDVARRAWALGILEDEKTWADAVRARNALAHEYPLSPTKRAEQLNGAWHARETLEATWRAIGRFIDEEGMLA